MTYRTTYHEVAYSNDFALYNGVRCAKVSGRKSRVIQAYYARRNNTYI